MKKSPLEFYIAEKARFENLLKEILLKLRWISVIRLVVFCTTVFFVYYFLGNKNLMLSSGILGSVLFVFFLKKYTNLLNEKKELQKLVHINIIEISALKGDYLDLETGEEFLDTAHFYSYDIDLFGRGSFFQFINRTATLAGRLKLVKLLTSNKITQIELKQATIRELAEKPKWRQQFSATASLIETTTPPDIVLKWVKEHEISLSKITVILSTIFTLISVGIIIGMGFKIVVFSHLIFWSFIGFGVSVFYFSKVNKVYENSTKARAVFEQYYKLLELIERETFKSEILKDKYSSLHTEIKKASSVFKEFSKILDALDQRNNLFFGIIGNSLFLWDLRQASKIEKWIANYKNKVYDWFEIVSFFDAQNTLANFTFNHPTYVFPRIKDGKSIIVATELGHPLLETSKRIASDCNIDSQDFLIITGANMAGKSTFLRTVSLNIVMANMGLPVCAKTIKYNPVKLITNMRTSDSLTNNTSYFFSELKRLKFIVEALKHEHYLIILDEILKGTNSTDKAIGAKKFIKKLINSKASGIIATHDLSLCTITKEYSQIQNHYFNTEIINNELYFDYKLKDGVCKNMNASFLLQKMEII